MGTRLPHHDHVGSSSRRKDIEKDAAATREYLAKGDGYNGIPLIQIGDRLLRGFNEEKIIQALKAVGQTVSTTTAE